METNKLSKSSIFVLSVLLLCYTWLLYQSGLLMIWVEDEEYGHGLMVLAVLAYVLYQNRLKLPITTSSTNWSGALISIIALVIFISGEISGIAPIRMYSVWIFATGSIIAIGGWNLFSKLIVALGIIFLLIPLPNVLGPMLTSQLQLISSMLGVWLIRLFGGVVYLEGNTIDMGSLKLLVAEACAGLRYLFPLMSIGAIAGYLMRAPLWMRWALFLITIPITIFMNSFRIAITGLLSDAYGMEHTEGFLHFFEGWVVFIVSLSILVLIAYLSAKFILGAPSLSTVFSIEVIANGRNGLTSNHNKNWHNKPPVILMLSMLVVAVISSSSLIERKKYVLNAKPLSEFPGKLGGWYANQTRLPVSLEIATGADDYYHGYFNSPTGDSVNLYISYYHDQKKGEAPHSPTLCIPGDGWKILSNSAQTLTTKDGKSIVISRLFMTKGDRKAIAYYWIKQGNKVFRQQYKARIELIRFAIQHNRADAALVRMLTHVNANETIEAADIRLQQVASEIMQVISEYVPD